MTGTTAAWWWAYRHQVRELRARSVLWIAGVSLVGAAFAVGWQRTYPTDLSRRISAAALEGVPVFEAVSGRTVALSTVEGFVLWRWGGFASVLVAAWAVGSASALVRVAEAEGRTELLRARLIGPRALLGSSLAAIITWFMALALSITVTHTLAGFDVRTAVTFGVALGALATVIVSLTVVVAQLVPSPRSTSRIVGGVVVAALLVRVVAAASWAPEWLWGATPFGWMTFLHESDGARGRVLVAFGVNTAVLVPLALALARRDLHGTRLVAARSGVAGADGAIARSGVAGADGAFAGSGVAGADGPFVGSTAGRAEGSAGGSTDRSISGSAGVTQLRFAWRTGSATALGWVLAVGVAGGVIGVLADDFSAAIARIPEAGRLGAQVGWQLDSPAGVVGSMLLLVVPVLGLLGTGQIAATRDDEASTRLEALLVRSIGRSHWLVLRLLVAAVWVVLAAGIAVLMAWSGTALVGARLPAADAVRTAANLVPLAWMFLGIGAALFGLAPRLVTSLAPALVLGAFVFDLIGGLFDLPEWIRRLGPFHSLQPVPGVDADLVAAVVMIGLALIASTIGVIGFRRRDLCGP